MLGGLAPKDAWRIRFLRTNPMDHENIPRVRVYLEASEKGNYAVSHRYAAKDIVDCQLRGTMRSLSQSVVRIIGFRSGCGHLGNCTAINSDIVNNWRVTSSLARSVSILLDLEV
jgi:hypothetical protein